MVVVEVVVFCLCLRRRQQQQRWGRDEGEELGHFPTTCLQQRRRCQGNRDCFRAIGPTGHHEHQHGDTLRTESIWRISWLTTLQCFSILWLSFQAGPLSFSLPSKKYFPISNSYGQIWQACVESRTITRKLKAELEEKCYHLDTSLWRAETESARAFSMPTMTLVESA